MVHRIAFPQSTVVVMYFDQSIDHDDSPFPQLIPRSAMKCLRNQVEKNMTRIAYFGKASHGSLIGIAILALVHWNFWADHVSLSSAAFQAENVVAVSSGDTAASLEQDLLGQDSAQLAKLAVQLGDPKRGAILFHQPHVSCVSCHLDRSGGFNNTLAPNLTQWPDAVSDQEIVQAVLEPSKRIRQGYQVTTLLDGDGKIVSGILVSDGDEIVLRDLTVPNRTMKFSSQDVEIKQGPPASPMPTGLVNQLANRGQFFDLIHYLIQLRDGGATAALRLRPPAHLITVAKIPEYESDIDHAGMIHNLDDSSFERGQAIYQRLCINCHGNVDQPGSLPTSLRFAEGRFKNGSDPFAMYQTLTRGYGMMQPQNWMVPQQKYDVIHYIRQEYLKPHNPNQLFEVTADWLSKLPAGDSRGPEPMDQEPWVRSDYGPTLINTYEVGSDQSNFAQKGIAFRLDQGPGGVSRGSHWMVFDHDTLRMAGAWSGDRFINWEGIHFDGRHNSHPRIDGKLAIENKTGPGWANPYDQSWEDVRLVGRDQRHYGSLPKTWGHFIGLHRNGDQSLMEYSIGKSTIYEQPLLVDEADEAIFGRRFLIQPTEQDLTLAIGQVPGRFSPDAKIDVQSIDKQTVQLTADNSDIKLISGFVGFGPNLVEDLKFEVRGNVLNLHVRAADQPRSFAVWFGSLPIQADGDLIAKSSVKFLKNVDGLDVDFFTKSAASIPTALSQKFKTAIDQGANDRALAVDVLQTPNNNLWSMQMRLTGLDFYPDGNSMAICTWDGDIWKVDGILDSPTQLTWQRIATGLFQPLGIKLVDQQIYVTCRDQIVKLHDLNDDWVTDYYENFNSDHQVTEHFHEFAMGLQRDEAGNFYYAKSARHALPAVVPQHGTLLKVSPDGSTTEILATGFRAANGVCLNPDGSFIVTDQEGHWNPKNRINWVKPGGFYGNMFGYHDVTDDSDSAMQQPLCWITNAFDRSPAELTWVPKNQWGPLAGSLLNLSYGYGKIYVVPFENLDHSKFDATAVKATQQGGMCELPIDQFPTGLIRGRFHPTTGDFYTCGMFAWAGNQQQPGGLYRVRYTSKPLHVPIELKVQPNGIEIQLTDPVTQASVMELANYSVQAWDLKRTANYGSPHVKQREWKVTQATLSADGKTIMLQIPEIEPTQGMEIRFELETKTGERFERTIHNSIHVVPKAKKS